MIYNAIVENPAIAITFIAIIFIIVKLITIIKYAIGIIAFAILYLGFISQYGIEWNQYQTVNIDLNYYGIEKIDNDNQNNGNIIVKFTDDENIYSMSKADLTIIAAVKKELQQNYYKDSHKIKNDSLQFSEFDTAKAISITINSVKLNIHKIAQLLNLANNNENNENKEIIKQDNQLIEITDELKTY